MTWRQWMKNLLNPYSRVPPSSLARFFPRLLRKFEPTERDLNAEFPGTVHKHIKTHQGRFMEQGAGDRVATKWSNKPWERSYTGQGDHPITKRELQATKDQERMVGIHYYNQSGRPWTQRGKFPLYDFDFPMHPGRVVLRWLYERGEEPLYLQRQELITPDFEVPMVFPFGWCAPSAIMIGNACISNDAAVYDGCVLKGDQQAVWVGPRSHVLEGCILTSAPATPDRPGLGAVIVGFDSVIGANCTLTGCMIGDRCTIGAGSTIGFGARVDDGSIVGAGSFVEEDQYIPASEVWVGRPARYLRKAGDVDGHTAIFENQTLRRVHLEYSNAETTKGAVWAEYDAVVDNLERELGVWLGRPDVVGALKSKAFDPQVLKLPKSLVTDLMECVGEADHPNPKPSLSAQAREHFSSPYDFNRRQEQRPVYTGNYNSPTMARDMA